MAIPGTGLRAGLALAALMLLAACGGGGSDGGEKKEASTEASRQSVTVATVVLVDQPRTVTASGTVSAWEEVPVGAETGGLVAVAVYVDEGSWVRQGQPLVKLNDALVQAELRQQQAGVATAEANAEREDADLARAEELKSRGYLSQASLDMAIAEQRAARAQLASARAALAATQTRLDQTTIRAPVAGQIVSRSVTRGQIVQPGVELFRMVRDGRLELDAQVPETDLGLVRAGMTAEVVSDQAAPTTGRVRIVTPEVSPTTRLGLARISLASGSGLRPGMFARARIDVGSQPAATVPTAAILYRENRAGVFVLQTDGSVRFRPVTVLSRASDRSAISGVDAGVRVVVEGAGFLGDGDRVSVAPAATRPAAAPAATTR